MSRVHKVSMKSRKGVGEILHAPYLHHTICYQPSSSGITLPSSLTVPHHIGRVGCKGFPVSLSTSKSLGMTKAECLHQGFHSSCHHSTSTSGSSHHRFTPKATSNYHLPTIGIPYLSAQVAPHGKTRPRLVVILARSTQPSPSTHPSHTHSTLPIVQITPISYHASR